MLFRRCLALLGSDAEAHDCLQDTFVGFLKGNWRGEAQPLTVLYRVATNQAIDRLRKRLGGLATQQALAAVAAGDFASMVELVLDYYDKTYTHGLAPQPGDAAQTPVPVPACDPAENAAALLWAVPLPEE